ncbi:hypothetical protein VM98_37175, partial [Streptomyces rubellomurinus subsp. indigoferus]
AVLLGADLAALRFQLAALADGSATRRGIATQERRVAFVLNGDDGGDPDWAARLLSTSPAFAARPPQTAAALAEAVGWTASAVLRAPPRAPAPTAPPVARPPPRPLLVG